MILGIILIAIIFLIFIFAQSDDEPQQTTHYTDVGEYGYIYILHNECFKDNWYKIGMTTRQVEDRVREHNTSVPVKFNILAEWLVDDVYNREQEIHEALDDFRPDRRREWFKCSKEELEEKLLTINWLKVEENEK